MNRDKLEDAIEIVIIVFLVLIGILCMASILLRIEKMYKEYKHIDDTPVKKEIIIKNVLPINTELTEENLYEALLYYNIKYPEIVYSQAILESNIGNSDVYKRTNNLFGLYNSNKKDYYKYDSWIEGLVHYKIVIQSQLKQNENYYDFLKRIKYAKDPNYINKLKTIVKQNDKRRNQ